MKRPFLLAAALALLPVSALAHKAWLLPSQTVLAGNQPWISVDAAVSNDLFYFNHVPLRLDNLTITAPDGSTPAAQNPATGKYRSVFDLPLSQTGTYRLSIVNRGLTATWTQDGKPKRWRGDAAAFARDVPTDAADLKVSQMLGRVETFVSNGAPSLRALQPTGSGLELLAVTHPNDLFAGEPARFKLQIDGKPAVGLKVEIIRGGTRYRNAQDEINVITDADGGFSVTWPEAGMYWLQTSSQDDKTSVPQAQQRRLSYVATLEVLPQ